MLLVNILIMKYSPHTLLASALLFLQAATVARTQEEPVQIPKVAFTEVRTDSLKRVSLPGEAPAFAVSANTETTIALKFPLVDFAPGSVDESTLVGINVGGFSHEAALGDSPNWRSGRNRAKFPIFVETDRLDDEGDPVLERVGSIVYTWTDRKLVVTVSGHGVGSIVADSAEDFFADVEGSKVRFIEPIDASVSFGDQSGSTSLYAKGVVRKVTKRKGAGDAAESFDLYFLQAVSYYDTTPPEVVLIDPANNTAVDTEFLTLTGMAKDNVDSPSSLELTKVLVNGVDVTDDVSAEFTDGDATEEPPVAPEFVVDGIALASGENTIEMFVSDTSGNTTRVTRHITYTGAGGTDTTAPVLNIESPAEGAVLDSDILSLSGTATDNLDDTSLLEVVQVLVNGVDVTAGVTWSFEDGNATVVPAIPGKMHVNGLTLRGGLNTIVVTVSDDAGNTTTVTRHVTYFVQS